MNQAAPQNGPYPLRVTFVHTPMAAVPVPERHLFWQGFDLQYHAAHPRLRHMKDLLWELPHWMHWLGGVLVDAGYPEVDVLDLYFATARTATGSTGLDVSAAEAAIRAHPSDVFLFSPMTVNLHIAYQIAEIVKAVHPKATTIFGGVVATPLCLEVAAHPGVDFVVVGRGELALPALLDTIRTASDPCNVGNLAFAGPDGTPIATMTQYPHLTAEQLPFPKVDLFPEAAGESIRYIRQVYALGCPYKCSFCTIQTIGRRPDYFPIERVLAEIRAYRERYGTHHHIYWGDETFTLNRERTLALLSALEHEGDVEYDCQTRLNCLTDDRVLHALRRSGCRWVEIGIETRIQDSHDRHKNRMKVGSTEDTLQRVRDAGLATCSFAVNGFPEQTPDEMKRSIEWLCSLIDRDLLQASYLTELVPYPGSAMYSEPSRFGMQLLHRDFSQYSEDQPPVFATALATPDDVYEVFTEGLVLLGDAMAEKTSAGSGDLPADRDKYGRFWSSAHV
jgi:anaerobic magnesium-protoporphyrin IX monomethyl ester cyclase